MKHSTSWYLLLMYKAEEEERLRKTPTRNQNQYRQMLDDYERYIRQRRIPRHSLLPVDKSAWRKAYTSGDNQAMITLTGFDMDSFHYICNLFAPMYDNYSPFIDANGYIRKKKSKAGRPRLMNAMDCLGLILGWTRTRGSATALQLIFGTTMTPTCKYLQFARRILVYVLHKDVYAKISMPTNEKLEEYRNMIATRHPALQNVWGFIDGLKLTIVASSDFIIQRAFCNGWK